MTADSQDIYDSFCLLLGGAACLIPVATAALFITKWWDHRLVPKEAKKWYYKPGGRVERAHR